MREGAIKRVGHLLGLGTPVRNRDWVSYSCPFARFKHPKGTDRKPSFGIRVKNGGGGSHYFCFTCHSAGPVSYLPIDLAAARGQPAKSANELMFQILRIETDEGFGLFEEQAAEEEAPKPLGKEYWDIFPPVYDDKAAMAYMRERGISNYAIDKLDIRYDPEDERVVFPVMDREGAVYGYTGRSILPEHMWPTNRVYGKSKDYLGLPKRHMLLGVHLVDYNDHPIVPVEGPFDTARGITLLQREPYNVVGCLGSRVTTEQAATLIALGRKVCLMLDNDKAGDDGIYGTEKRRGAIDVLIKELPVCVPRYPDRDDANDVGSLRGKELLHALQRAKLEKYK